MKEICRLHWATWGVLNIWIYLTTASLVILKVSYNKLSGEVFQESVNFTGIYALFLDNNQFTGKIGHGLRRLDISNGNLTGVIPSWIGYCFQTTHWKVKYLFLWSAYPVLGYLTSPQTLYLGPYLHTLLLELQ